MDNEHEAMIQSALEQLQGRMTIIVIAHRLSTISHADQVFVLEDGKLIQQGTYAVLSNEKKGLFHKLLDYERLVSTEG
ncbi:Lipid A export ATP-binding/permease protein MsbA [compost metagenome]